MGKSYRWAISLTDTRASCSDPESLFSRSLGKIMGLPQITTLARRIKLTESPIFQCLLNAI
jgi:hypothetical protein